MSDYDELARLKKKKQELLEKSTQHSMYIESYRAVCEKIRNLERRLGR